MKFRVRPTGVDVVGGPSAVQRHRGTRLPSTAATNRRFAPTEYTDHLAPGIGPQAEAHDRPRLVLITEGTPIDPRQARFRFLGLPS